MQTKRPAPTALPEVTVKLNMFPTDARFFGLFDQQAELIQKMCLAFKDFLVDHENREAKLQVLTDTEHRGDELFHELSLRLSATFVTPIDREDIHEMGSSMDDVLDLIQGSASRMQLFECGEIKPCLFELADIMVECSDILRQGIQRLPKFQDLSDLRKPLKTLETKGDRINRQAVADLFRNCQTVQDVVDLIKWKEIIENAEDAIDKFEDVFDVIENVVVKHA